MTKKRKTNKQSTKKAKKAPKSTTPSAFSQVNWKYVSWGVLALIGVFIFSMRLNFLGIPMERDEGIYAYFGQLILDGKTPYIDFHENKFPCLYYIYALLVGLTGQTLKGIQFAFILINIGTMLFIYNACTMFFDRFAGLVAAMSFAILSMTMGMSGFTTQSEHIVIFFFSMGLFLLTKSFENDSAKLVFFSGVAICVGFLVKTTGVFLIIFGGLAVVSRYFFTKERDFKRLFKQTALYSAGVFGIFGLICLLMLAQGALEEMFYWTVVHSKNYVSSVSMEYGMERLFQGLKSHTTNYMPFWLSAAAGMVALFFTKVDQYKKLLFLCLAPIAFFTIVPGMRFYGHYWIQLTPALAILIGITFYSIKEVLTARMSKNVAFGIPVAIFMLFVFMNISTFKGYYFSPDHYKVIRGTYGMNPFPEAMKIANFVKTRSKPADEMVLFGTEPQIYFYTDRRCPSEHAYFSYLMNDQSIPKVAESIKEFKASVNEAKPKHLIFFNHPISILAQENADMTLFDWMNEFIRANKYQRIGVVDVVSNNDVKYIFDESAAAYKPTGERQMYIFERP